jgi:GNAT superfamily N-acetyltransferase
MNIQIDILQKNDYIDYLNLMKQFRPIEYTISFENFCQYYDIIFRNSEIFVARLNDKIVGSITVIYDQKFINNYALYAHIEDVVVDEDYRTLKIGSKLIEHVKIRCIEKNCRKCSLVCSKEISSFYLKNHFEEKGIHMSFIPLNI